MSLSGFDVQEGLGRERRRRVFLSAGTAAVMRGSNFVTLLISIPLLLDYLGTEQFGVWMTIVSVAALFAFVDLGLGNGLVNAVAAADGRNDHEAARRAISSAYFLIISLAGVLAVTLVLLYRVVPWAEVVNASGTRSASLVPLAVAALAAFVLLSLPAGLVLRVQTGLQHGFQANTWAAFAGPLSLGALLAAMELNASLPWLVAAYACGPVVASAANTVNFFGRRRSDLRPKVRDFDSEVARRLLSVGIAFSVLQLAAVAAYQLDALVIAHVLGPSHVADYTVPLQLYLVVPVVVGLFLIPLWPAYGESIARGDIQWARQTLARSVWLTVGGSTCAVALLTVAAPTLIRLWVGPGIDPPFALLAGLALWMVVMSVGTGLSMFLNGVGVVRLQALLGTAMVVGKLVLAVALTNAFGLSGVVWGSVISQLVFVLIPLAVLMPRLLVRLDRQRLLPATLAET